MYVHIYYPQVRVCASAHTRTISLTPQLGLFFQGSCLVNMPRTQQSHIAVMRLRVADVIISMEIDNISNARRVILAPLKLKVIQRERSNEMCVDASENSECKLALAVYIIRVVNLHVIHLLNH